MVSDELLALYKLSIGDFSGNNLDDYYKNFLSLAIADLESDDISDENLNSDLGMSATVLYAMDLMDGNDITQNNALTMIRNKLAILTKGDRQDVQQP